MPQLNRKGTLNLKRTSRGNNKKNKGATLIEMLVYSSLFIVVFTGVYMVFDASVKYYYITQSNVWVQQGALNAVSQLSREVAESNLSSVVLYNSSPEGIVFMTPRSSANTISYNTTSGYEGKPYWQKYVCYYLYTDPSDSSKKAVYRKEIAVTALDAPAPSGTYTTSYFATGGGASLSYKIAAYNITSFDIYWMNVGAKSYGTPAVNPVYIKITAQDNSAGKSNTYETTDSIDVLN